MSVCVRAVLVRSSLCANICCAGQQAWCVCMLTVLVIRCVCICVCARCWCASVCVHDVFVRNSVCACICVCVASIVCATGRLGLKTMVLLFQVLYAR